MYDPRDPAPRPGLAPLKSHSAVLSKSPAALYGATSAFSPKPPNPTIGESPVSAGARLAALTAGTQAQRRNLPAPRLLPNERPQTPVDHGRDIPLHNTLVSSNIGSVAIPNTHTQFTRPPVLSRSSSALAAQRASANSISPQRISNKSPKHNTISGPPPTNNEKQNYTTHVLPETMAFVPARQHAESAQARLSEPVRERILAFEKLPSLPASKSSSALTKVIASNSSFQADQPPQLESELSRHIALDNVASKEDASDTATTAFTMPSELSRQSSDVSATVSESAASRTTWKGTHLPRSEYLPIPVSRPGRTPFQTTTTQKHDVRQQDGYRNAMTVNALADAMVASSLASSRAASPSKRSPPPVPRRRSRSVAALYDFDTLTERGSKEKPKRKTRAMKHTLRKQVSSDDDEIELAKRGRHHWVRKHPNMHSEGNRKRWRDKVTELERKRYEGVFAANRGSLIGSGRFEPSVEALSDFSAPGNRVINIVVRDIWERSRLPREVLREIYDLVSPGQELALGREQFVVGLWLIDQRLKGRKLPVKVSPSVWDSVRHSQGIKIRRQLL